MSNQRRATGAYKERYRRHGSVRIYEEEKRGGMKRVDFFMGHTWATHDFLESLTMTACWNGSSRRLIIQTSMYYVSRGFRN